MPKRGLFTYENALVLILGVTFGVVFFDRQAASNLINFIQPDLKLTETDVGLLGSALSATWAISAYLVGLISDRTGKRKSVLIVCVVGFSLCSIISGLAPSFPILAASRFLMGLLEGGVMPICLAIMTVESSEHRRGLNAGVVQNGFSNLIGNALGPIVLIAIASALNWRDAFFVAAAPGLLCAAAIWLWVKEPPKPAPSHPGATLRHMSFIEMLKVRNVLICCLVSIFMVSWLITGFAFLPRVFGVVRHFSNGTVGNLMGSLGFCAFLAGALLPGVSDRIGRKPVLIIACFASILAPLAALYIQGSILMMAAVLFIGWVGNGVFPMFMGTIPGESLPRENIATAMGIVVGVGEILGGVIGPIVAGWLADHTSLKLDAPMFMMMGCALIAGCLALFLKETAPAKVGHAAAARVAVQEAA
jgi:MFS family permease